MKIIVPENKWVFEGVFNRNDFNNFIVDIVRPFINSLEDLKNTVLVLPPTVTKFQRYNIHKLSIPVDFSAHSSENEYEERIIEIRLSRYYVKDLFKNVSFTKVENKINIIFDNLIKFMETNFPDEMKNYVNNV